ncbi:MAG: hypothetical protein ACMUHM_02000 [Thermoplasmatota archaeon]
MEDPETAAFQLWKGLRPGDAYLSGIDEAGGTLFIPSRENIRTRRSELDAIWRSTLDISLRSLLRCSRCDLDLQEPQRPPDDIYRYITAHIIKGGIQNPLLPPLLKDSRAYLERASSDLRIMRWPLEVQFQSLFGIDRLKDLLKGLPRSPMLAEPVKNLLEITTEYGELFTLGDISRYSHEDVISTLEEGDGHVGRGDIYPRILGELYACPDRAAVMEESLVLELYNEIPGLNRTMEELSDFYGTDLDLHDIDVEMASQRRIRVQETIRSIENIRNSMIYWGIRRLIDYPHEVDVGFLETPSYLRSFIPSMRMINMDGLPARPRSDLFITLDPGSYRPLSFPDIVLMVAREELGIRAQYLNSYLRPLEVVKGTDLLSSYLIDSISMGFAMARELEVLGMFRDMATRRSELLRDETDLVELIEEYCPIDDLVADLEFLLCKERVLSLIRAVADIRVNSGKQSILEFMRWAQIISGLGEPLIMEAIWDAVSRPGLFASCMSILPGVRKTSQEKVDQGVSPREFNTYSTSLGFPAWKVLRERMLEI